MEKQKKSGWKNLVLTGVLIAVMVYELINDLATWAPHGDSGFMSGAVSLGVGIYAFVTLIRRWRAGDRLGWIAAIVLLIFAGIIFWISNTIPFCPKCDLGVRSPLMRWILADKL